MPYPDLRDLVAVLLGELEQADLVDRAQVARREAQAYVTTELRNPEFAALNINVLPTRGLDVGVGNVTRAKGALSSDLTLRHGGAEASSSVSAVQ